MTTRAWILVLAAGLAGCGGEGHLTRRDAKAQIEKNLKAGNQTPWLKDDMRLSRFDHVDVMGILEDGIKAKADVLVTFRITPEGMAKIPEAKAALEHEQNILLSDWFAMKWAGKGDKYGVKKAYNFVKYDDGWRYAGGGLSEE